MMPISKQMQDHIASLLSGAVSLDLHWTLQDGSKCAFSLVTGEEPDKPPRLIDQPYLGPPPGVGTASTLEQWEKRLRVVYPNATIQVHINRETLARMHYAFDKDALSLDSVVGRYSEDSGYGQVLYKTAR